MKKIALPLMLLSLLSSLVVSHENKVPVEPGESCLNNQHQPENLINDAQKAGFEIVKVNTELLERDNIYFLRPKK